MPIVNKFFRNSFIIFFVLSLIPILVSAQQSSFPEKITSRVHKIRALVEAKTNTTLSSQIAAEVKKTPFSNGESFSKGDVLVELDCRHYKLALKRARANLSYATNNRKNKEQLARSKSVGKLEISLSKVEESMAKADVEMASLPVSNCLIIAPFNGRVTNIRINLYQFVESGEELLHIINTQDYEIHVIVPSKWITWLKAGFEFSVYIDELNSSYKARILQVGSTVESVSQTIAITAEFLKIPEGILSGMSGTAILKPQ